MLDDQPRTRGELGNLLAERWPEAHPSALAYAATHHIAVCQVPPRGIWGKPFTKLPRADRNALLAEAAQLCAFVIPRAEEGICLHEP